MKAIVLVTGVKVRESCRIFPHSTAQRPIWFGDKRYKLNTAAGVAVKLAEGGYHVHMQGYANLDLEVVAQEMTPGSSFSAEVANPLDAKSVGHMVEEVRKLKTERELPVHVVHYGGASSTTQPLPGDTVFMPAETIPPEAFASLVSDNCGTLCLLYQTIRPLLLEQSVSKIVEITAIASTRAEPLGALDCAQKGAMRQYLASLRLEAVPQGIYPIEVRPGCTDTGYYDRGYALTSY